MHGSPKENGLECMGKNSKFFWQGSTAPYPESSSTGRSLTPPPLHFNTTSDAVVRKHNCVRKTPFKIIDHCWEEPLNFGVDPPQHCRMEAILDFSYDILHITFSPTFARCIVRIAYGPCVPYAAWKRHLVNFYENE